MNILIYGWFGEKNIGDELILDATIKLLKKNIPECNINVIGTKPKTIKKIHHGFNIASTYFDFRLSSIYKVLKNGFFSTIYNLFFNDILVIVSGGALSDWHESSTKNLFFMIDFFSFLKKKVFMVDIGAGPINVQLSGNKFLKKLKKVEFISVRDESSYNQLKLLNVCNVYLSRDIVYSLYDEFIYHYSKVIADKKSVGLILAPVCYETESIFDEYINQINLLLQKLINNDYKVSIIPFLYDEDIIFYKKIDIPSQVEILYDCKDIFKTIFFLAKQEFVISVRYHGLVLAAMLGKKIIPLVHHSKNGDFAKDFGIEIYSEHIGDGNNWYISQISADNIIRNLSKIDFDLDYQANLALNLQKKLELKEIDQNFIHQVKNSCN